MIKTKSSGNQIQTIVKLSLENDPKVFNLKRELQWRFACGDLLFYLL